MNILKSFVTQTTKNNRVFSSERGQPLYSSGHLGTKYIDENRNFDICVADSDAFSVVVVNQAGKLRFTYTGASSPIERRFFPRGISTDSQSRILIADENNCCIHIIDEDGQLLSLIDNCDLHLPWDLCVDTKDNIFVIESVGCKLKKIKCQSKKLVLYMADKERKFIDVND